jgi:hypothetical protein
MKKAQGTLLSVIVIAVAMIAFAGIFLYIFPSKLHAAPSYVEGFFPEKCAISGLTRDQYFKSITEAISSIPPQTTKALALHTEMKTCFPDAELPGDYKDFLVNKGINAIDFQKLRADASIQSMQKALQIYEDSKSLMSPEKWKPSELILFSRAMLHLGGSAEGAEQLLGIVMNRKDSTDAQKAEALYLQAAFLERDVKLADANAVFKEIISEYEGKTADKAISFVVGRAKLIVGKANNDIEMQRQGLTLLDAATYTKDQYVYDSAAFYFCSFVAINAITDENKLAAAKSFESLLLPQGYLENSPYYPSAVATYSKIDNQFRAIKDCTLNEISSSRCMCKGTISSVQSCLCVNPSCEMYLAKDACKADICKVQGHDMTSIWFCVWDGSSCQMKTTQNIGYGGGY